MSNIITISEQDLRDVLAAAFSRGTQFYNVYKPKSILDFKDKLIKEEKTTVDVYIKYAKDQMNLRDFLNKKREDC